MFCLHSLRANYFVMNDKCPDSDKYIYIIRQMLDQEASEKEEAFLMDHIEDCAPCLKEYQLEQQIRTLIKSKFDRKSVPEELAIDIRAKIQRNLRG